VVTEVIVPSSASWHCRRVNPVTMVDRMLYNVVPSP
jgi:hypothetical protein